MMRTLFRKLSEKQFWSLFKPHEQSILDYTGLDYVTILMGFIVFNVPLLCSQSMQMVVYVWTYFRTVGVQPMTCLPF